MGYKLEGNTRISGLFNAIYIDWENSSTWEEGSNFRNDDGIGWQNLIFFQHLPQFIVHKLYVQKSLKYLKL